MNERQIPLFPLRTVVFPGGPLRLRIFEPRYLDMVSQCLKQETGFGVVLIREGSETGPSQVYEIGTLAFICDWYTLSGGLLGITAVGAERFRLKANSRRSDRLMIGDVEVIAAPAPTPPAARHARAATALKALIALAAEEYPLSETRFDDAAWVSGRLAELLPVSNLQKQAWLELDDPVERLDSMMPFVQAVRFRQ